MLQDSDFVFTRIQPISNRCERSVKLMVNPASTSTRVSPYIYIVLPIHWDKVRCLRLLGVKLGYNYLATPVAEIEMLYGLQPLQERRKYIDILFLYRLVNGFLDCPHLVSDIDYSIPRASRGLLLEVVINPVFLVEPPARVPERTAALAAVMPREVVGFASHCCYKTAVQT
ncbi:hypothetical protein J6590_045920 [Homalodisca vitripennis]|nr:hypothetical protein J6590_045920 [Homalodisca vitripennis]